MKVLIRYTLITLLFLVFGINDGRFYTQGSYEINKTIQKLEIVNPDFIFLLDSLINNEKKCSYYNSSLIWSVSFIDFNEHEFAIYITMQSEVSENYMYLGYFETNNTFFLLSGNYIHKDFFKKLNNEETFRFKKNKMPQIEDFSVWIYGYENKNLFLRESYPLPCKQF